MGTVDAWAGVRIGTCRFRVVARIHIWRGCLLNSFYRQVSKQVCSRTSNSSLHTHNQPEHRCSYLYLSLHIPWTLAHHPHFSNFNTNNNIYHYSTLISCAYATATLHPQLQQNYNYQTPSPTSSKRHNYITNPAPRSQPNTTTTTTITQSIPSTTAIYKMAPRPWTVLPPCPGPPPTRPLPPLPTA